MAVNLLSFSNDHTGGWVAISDQQGENVVGSTCLTFIRFHLRAIPWRALVMRERSGGRPPLLA
eukprot:768441-Hanusia_phi.AAC.3